MHGRPGRSVAGVAAAAVVLAACGGGGEAIGDAAHIDGAAIEDLDASAAREVAAGLDEFGLALHVLLAQADDAQPNVVTSPLSVGTLLAMVAGGATDATADALVDALSLEAARDPRHAALLRQVAATSDATVGVGNAVWVDDGATLDTGFEAFAQEVFGATADTVDLGAPAGADAVDAWVEDRTNGLVDGIAEGLGLPAPDVAAVLANAVYFLGEWTTSFDPDDTRPGAFRRLDGTEVEVPMMHLPAHGEHDVEVASDGDVRLLHLPYGDDGTVAMEVLLPPEGEDPAALLERLGVDGIEALVDVREPIGSGAMSMPRLEVEWRSSLVEVLTDLGLGGLFAGGIGGIVSGGDGFSELLHATYVRIDEEGTEAAAVTGGAVPTSMPISIDVDRPYAFVIRDGATGTHLFVGTVTDPSA